MHVHLKTLRTSVAPGLAIAVATSLVGSALVGVVSLESRHDAAQSLQESLGTAVHTYQRRQGLSAIESRGAKNLVGQRAELARVGKEKRAARLRMAAVLKDFVAIRKRYAIREENPERLEFLLDEGKKAMIQTAKEAYLRDGSGDASAATRSLLRLLFHGDDGVQASDWRHAYIDALQRATDLAKTLSGLRARHEELIVEYGSIEKAFDRSQGIVRVSRAEAAAIQAIVRDVHEQVLLLQGQLARIDAQLKERAERSLIEKGLMIAKPEHEEQAVHPQFSWPAYGALSAGFLHAKYKEHFGVPHYGADIVVGEGSPVYSAADGIVFLVRDGGALGYTYVLIGHKNAYATLYGHLSSVVVTAGQRVTAGQMMGLSGGKPGTPGSGPMTTGPHLHFEVIQGGVNVDPLTVLP